VKEPDLKKLAIAIFALCLLEALYYFWMGWWAYSTFQSSGATTSQTFEIARGEWSTGFFIVIAGFLHWVAPSLRLPIAVAGVFGGFYAAFFMIKSPNLLYSWDILHGDIVAAGNWSEAILIALALLCAAELTIMARGAK
jgi:hypothetical protein